MQNLELNKELGTTDMQIIIKGRFPGRPTEIIPAGYRDYEPNSDGSDEGKFYIEGRN